MAEDGVLPCDVCGTSFICLHYDALISLIYTFQGYGINNLRPYAFKEGIKHYSRGKGSNTILSDFTKLSLLFIKSPRLVL